MSEVVLGTAVSHERGIPVENRPSAPRVSRIPAGEGLVFGDSFLQRRRHPVTIPKSNIPHTCIAV
jgi:hypothetical protein